MIAHLCLQRVQFNRDTQMAYKSQAYVKFGETIFMDRFLDSASPEKRALSKALHSELTATRDRVHKLTQGKVNTLSFHVNVLYSTSYSTLRMLLLSPMSQTSYRSRPC